MDVHCLLFYLDIVSCSMALIDDLPFVVSVGYVCIIQLIFDCCIGTAIR